jgi:NAD(P)-dependent dehydrogenase (short-subunit alcohol dehydrogenase family)
METCLRVLQQAGELEIDDPARAQLEYAVAQLVKTGKKKRKVARAARRRELELDALRALDARRWPAEATAVLPDPYPARPCYICKQPYTRRHATYHAICPDCAPDQYMRRIDSASLEGRYALVTGGRIRIGRAVALKLLRSGARVMVTSRFPHDARKRFEEEPDAAQWMDRLELRGLDLRDVRQLDLLCAELEAAPAPLDILIQNAAQTIWRPPAYWRGLASAEVQALGADLLPARVNDGLTGFWERCAQAEPDTLFPPGLVDMEGEPLDLRELTSWRQRLDEVSPAELVESWLINTLAPTLLCKRLRPVMLRSPHAERFIVHVTSSEGRLDYNGNNGHHPHTNMAKAALDMLTRTIARDFARDHIHVTSVDPGWVSNMHAEHVRQRQEERGERPPLAVEDGAARVLDPIWRGVRGEQLWSGVLLKDYAVYPWGVHDG